MHRTARRSLPRVLGREQAFALGFSRHAIDHRLQAGTWQRILPATYLTADELTERDRLTAALVFAGRDAALSGAAALRAVGVRTVAMPARVLVLVGAGNRLESYQWVRIRRTTRTVRARTVSGLQLADAARSAADLALELRALDDVRALVARVVREGHCTVDGLRAELEAGPRQGSGFLRRALAEVTLGAASAPEARAATALRGAGLPPFRQNAVIMLPGGGHYVADFLWDDLCAILEIDSVEYHLGPQEWRATMDRHLHLSTLGYSVVHRPPSALRDPQAFVADIAAWLASCAARRVAS